MRQQEMVIGIFAIGGVLCSMEKDHLPFKLPVTNSFIRSLKANLPRTRSERQMWPSKKPVSRLTAVFRRHQDQQAKQFTKMPPPLYKIQVWGKNSNIREFSRIKNRVFHSATVRKTINLTMPMCNIKKCSRNLYVVKFSSTKYESVVFPA